jgi:hypothetical protein
MTAAHPARRNQPNLSAMSLIRSARSPLLLAATLLSGIGSSAAEKAPAKADYPLTTCVVSDDKLGGSMGKAIEYTYKQAGKPDRLVMFCCKDCIADFEKEPAKYLAKLDAAAAAKAKASKKS